MDEKDQNPKAQPSTFKIVAHRIFWKIDIFGENPKKLKIRYLKIRCLIRKRSARALNGPIGPLSRPRLPFFGPLVAILDFETFLIARVLGLKNLFSESDSECPIT